ncbi:PLP-dependent aminotransferase family protein [Aurantivibrio infirmus]
MSLTLASNGSGPLYRQVFETLRHAITSGAYKSEQRLPATRELSAELGVSRNTVNTAYDMLQAEGYLESRPNSGYYVTARIPADSFEILAKRPRRHPSVIPQLSNRGKALARPSRPVAKNPNPSFVPGLPDLGVFPYSQWQQCLQKTNLKLTPGLMSYQDQGGLLEFKTALRDYLELSRAVKCNPEQIIVVNGSQAGLDLMARLLVEDDEYIAMEEPGYLGANDGFLAANAKILSIPVDKEGLEVERLDALNKKQQSAVKLIYTTPSYQFPLGVTMSLQRRLALLEWANTNNAFIIEDDYDSEFRYHDRPLSSLQGLDSQGRVLYMGTLSKVMFPGLRIGYLVVPENLSSAFASALRKTGQDAPLLLQAAMTQFIEKGFFSSHIRKMRKLYGRKQALLLELAEHHLHEWLSIPATSAGMQFPAFFRKKINEKKLLEATQQRKLNITSLNRYFAGRNTAPGLYLGYAGVPIEDLKKGVLLLKDAFRSVD